MSRKSEDFEIDGVRYSTTQYSGTKGLTLFAKIAKIAGKPIGILVGSGLDAEVKPNMIGLAVEALTQNLEPEDFVKTIKEILEGTIIYTDGENRPIIFDKDFGGGIGHLFKLLKHVLAFQYSDFLGGIAEITPAITVRSKQNRVKAI